MLNASSTPNLTFPTIQLGRTETPWNLLCLLYHGGAGRPVRNVLQEIKDGKLGKPIEERIELVTKIHENLHTKLISGGSKFSAYGKISRIKSMFKWAESECLPLNIISIQSTFLAWTDYLLYRQQIRKDLSQSSAYQSGDDVGVVLDEILNRGSPLISITRLRMPRRRKTAQGIAAEKQNLAETYSFGHFLQDICDALTFDVVMRSPLPVRIPLRDGGELIEWSGYNSKSLQRHRESFKLGYRSKSQEKSFANFAAYEADGTLRTRHPLINRRIEAELLMFIGQTGMNLSQAHKLKFRHFSYTSHLDGYQIRDRKARRGGEVLFEIFKEYKPHFERYLSWRRQVCPDSDAIFPLTRTLGRPFETRPHFNLRHACKNIGIKFVSPQKLRSTRVNWLLRQTGDANLTATMAQHLKETLLEVYEHPSQQRAISEVIRFWSMNDPSLIRTESVAPGECDGNPVRSNTLSNNMLSPDCIRPSGCMCCEHHRDIDTPDYVWSLACFRHLKIIELSKLVQGKKQSEAHPAELIIERISKKLTWFDESNPLRRQWLTEALARVEEGNYHPEWHRRITSVEESP
ncbi:MULTISPECIES: site-specific integrase [Pseudomonas]|uniref:Site-specific integrase n=1 Tax=Pseudomonas auratipiscis TaxID=3115853 RepID=A0AB35WSC2_9PSED|nr:MULTISPECIES: site-specific integrase [Pseudomonas]MDO1434406.1 site-specific integrase [Pseudomonas aeruginosa]MEE1867610.1 site-specific integrase [Pseudomonas sp. 120P]MEE1958437.1 site-specific integrase [Pseudomonas sp. 119P]